MVRARTRALRPLLSTPDLKIQILESLLVSSMVLYYFKVNQFRVKYRLPVMPCSQTIKLSRGEICVANLKTPLQMV